MSGRTTNRWVRFYAGGFDLSGYTRQVGKSGVEFSAESDAALSDAVKNALCGQATVTLGEFNGFLDNTATSGLHVVAYNSGVKRAVMIPLGINALPAAGDAVIAGEFEQLSYSALGDGSPVTVSITYGGGNSATGNTQYENPFGILLHAKGAETGANTATGIDDCGAATAFGGFMCYQLFTSDGTVTLNIQDAATNLDASFADLSGATSGSINASVTPAAGVVALSKTATVRRYLRWQMTLGTASTATFAVSFNRARY